MTQFDHLLRQGLMDANLEQYERVLQGVEAREPDFSPRYLRERMRLLADPQDWERRRAGIHGKRLNWRIIAIVAALLLLSACAVAVVTGQFSQWFPRLGADPKAPEQSEEVLTRTGTAIEQSRTVDGVTAALNAAVWDGAEVWLSFTVEEPIPPIRYGGAGAEVTVAGVPLRFTEFQLSALCLTTVAEVLAPVDEMKEGQEPDPSKVSLSAFGMVQGEGPWGVWTGDESYIDLTSMSGSGGGNSDPDGTYVLELRHDYPYPIDPASVTAVNVGGVRVELRELERLSG